MIIVVEPHADDAFLSLGQHIENWTKEGTAVQIVTVYSGTRKRGRDAEAYALTVGAIWKGLGFVEAGVSAGGMVQRLPRLPLELGKSRVIVPLGFPHPEHAEVRHAVENLRPDYLQYYVDAPYQISSKHSEEMNNAMYRKLVISILKPNARKWKHIPLFKDQSKFFYFNNSEKLSRCFEIIVEPE